MNDVEVFLEKLYEESLSKRQYSDFLDVSSELKERLDHIIASSENSKGVLAVVATSLIYKALNPQQDIRCHQQSIPGGYSGRTFDSLHVTPFLRSKSFPNMAESGWLTRSLEQKVPYTLDYPGAIRPKELKQAFLETIDIIQTKNIDTIPAIHYLFSRLADKRDSKKTELAKPKNLSISSITEALDRHFSHKYQSRGTSRLPVLAFYAIYQSLMTEVKRFEGKKLLPLENHTSADSQSGRLGDIDITDEDGNPFESVEVKHNIPVSFDIIELAKEKIMPTEVSRYYILSTSGINKRDEDKIASEINRIKNTHGCQIVINGILPSLKYYLRLLDNPTEFIENYVSLLDSDETVKFEHKEQWNKIISEI